MKTRKIHALISRCRYLKSKVLPLRCKITFTYETNRSLPADSKPVILPHKLDVPRKPRIADDSQLVPEPIPQSNGTLALTNGNGMKRKRSPEDSVLDQEQLLKRKRNDEDSIDLSTPNKKGKMAEDDMIVLDDSNGGAIVIDDD